MKRTLLILVLLTFALLGFTACRDKADPSTTASTPATSTPAATSTKAPSQTPEVTKAPTNVPSAEPLLSPEITSGTEPSITSTLSPTTLVNSPTPTKKPTKATPTPTKKPVATSTPTPVPKYSAGTILGNAPTLSKTGYFYTSGISVSVTAEKAGTIYYTLDGTEPTKSSKKYTSALSFNTSSGNYPKATILRAKAFYNDGSESPTVVHTYFISSSIKTRFSTYIFSITGDPKDLTNAPNGILYGKNYEKRGDASERGIYLEVLNKSGSNVISQYSGVRVYGGASRENPVKSLKLFARKSYASGIGKFKHNFFNTKDTNGDYIKSYDKLVLRNYGNDWQFGFLRDELNQRLAAKAGYLTTEAVAPAIVYLNGSYYNFCWLHESYCDDYFKKKFPKSSAKGEFTVIEGGDSYKNPEEDNSDASQISDYNAVYWKYVSADLTNNTNYNALNKLIDVENYLDYFAFNIYINNWDWPNNNYKCFRYYAASGESYGSGMYDGRWRYLLHDTDFCYGLYDQGTTHASYNNLNVVVQQNSSESGRYAPLFANLMKRESSRNYFIKKVLELSNGALSYDSINSMISTMRGEQKPEFSKYLTFIRDKYGAWTYDGFVDESIQMIRDFAKKRQDYMVSFMAKEFGMTEDEVLALE